MPDKVKHVLRHRFRDPDNDRLYVPHPQGKPVEVPRKLAKRDKFLSGEEDDEGAAPDEGTPIEEVEGLPHKSRLRGAGLTTVEAIEAAREDLADFQGIGQVIAERVRDFLDQRSAASPEGREAAGEGEEEEEGEGESTDGAEESPAEEEGQEEAPAEGEEEAAEDQEAEEEEE